MVITAEPPTVPSVATAAGIGKQSPRARSVRFCPSSDANDEQAATAFQLACLRHGAVADVGGKATMEDIIFSVADIESHCGRAWGGSGVKAFFAVFDGHSGTAAAEFAREHLLRFVTEHEAFPTDISTALRESFLRTDREYFQAVAAGTLPDSGTTALAVVVWGSTLYIANAGDSRAVICRARKPWQLTTDHRPICTKERARIVLAGGVVSDDARLNGALSVSRALGNFLDSGLKIPGVGPGSAFSGPLIAEPEVVMHTLTAEDEFLVLACDGLWDYFPNERVIELARESLGELNDPGQCAKDLIEEAKRVHAADNLSVITCCFSSEAPRRRTFSLGRSWSVEALTKLQGALGVEKKAGAEL